MINQQVFISQLPRHKNFISFEILLFYFITFLSLSTLIVVIGEFFQVGFKSLALLISSLAILAVCLSSIKITKLLSQNPTINFSFIRVVIIIALVSGILSASIIRFDYGDDAVYMPKAVFLAENPDSSINKNITWLAGINALPQSGSTLYYEIIQAALAYTSGLPAIDYYHVVFPFLVGFFAFIAFLLLLTLFESDTNKLILGLFFYLLLLLSLGENEYVFANQTLSRAAHGKALFFAVGIPAWIYCSIIFLKTGSRPYLLMLFLLAIALMGTTTTSIVFLPFLSLLLWLSYNITFHKFRLLEYDIKPGFLYCLTLAPVLLLGLSILEYANTNLGNKSNINSEFSSSFHDQFSYAFSADLPLTLICFSLTILAIGNNKKIRMFIFSWTSLAVILFLNPLTAPYIIKYLTTENIYWRLFFLLPFPLIAVLAFISVYDQSRLRKLIVILVLTVFSYLAVLGPGSILRHENRVSGIVPFAYNLDSIDHETVRFLIEKYPPGSMFAPLEVSSVVLMLTSKFPQYHLNYYYLEFLLSMLGNSTEYTHRTQIYQYLYVNNMDDDSLRSIFENFIKREQSPDIFVLKNGSTNRIEAENILSKNSYRRDAEIRDLYTVFVKQEGANKAQQTAY